MADAAPAPARVVQIAPNDHPPFADITQSYRAALESLGLQTRTVILGSPHGSALPHTIYLGLDDLSQVRQAGLALREQIRQPMPGLAICHRYRSYRVLRASAVSVPRVVTVAHEFGLLRRLQRRLERALFARHVLFAGVSPAVQAELGKSVADPLCLPNALDLARFESIQVSREQALEILDVPVSDSFTIGLVGRLVEKKAPELALEAVRHLLEEGRDVRLLVIGDGPLALELARRASGLPIIFCGFVPDARRLLSALDVMLLTSREVEAFGMVALEAMASGIPVVAGPAPGPQFVLGGCGYYYTERQPESVAAALMRVEQDLVDGTLDERMARGRDRALREFSIAALAGRLDELFFQTRGHRSE